MKIKRCKRGFFGSFSKRGSALYEADRRGGGKQYSEPKNDVMYRFCMISIDHTVARTR